MRLRLTNLYGTHLARGWSLKEPLLGPLFFRLKDDKDPFKG